jgi:cyanosortase A-associated protein
MNFWQKVRLPFLQLVCIYVFITFCQAIFTPNKSQSQSNNFSFPEQVTLPNLDFIVSEKLPPNNQNSALGRYYKYRQNQTDVEISMRYETNTDGEVTKLIPKNTSIPLDKIQNDLLIRSKTNIGHYGLFIYQEKAHLTTCINPVGLSTFTKAQFNANVKQYSLTFHRILDYVLTGRSPRDR